MREDEKYIIDLCDKILQRKAFRQHKFDFLKGDTGRKLPVDAYYQDYNLVIEFHEKQHTERVPFFDKRITASRVTRGEQRKIYDQRRRDVLPQRGINLIEFSINEFKYTSGKRLARDTGGDKIVIQDKLAGYIKKVR